MSAAHIIPKRLPVAMNFNRRLLALSKKMNADDVTLLKEHFKSDRHPFLKEKISNVSDPLGFLSVTCDLGLLSRDNLDIFKESLFVVNNKEIIKEAASGFLEDHMQVHHLDSRDKVPGFQTVEFSIKDANRNQIDQMRLVVSDITFAPIGYVTVKGISSEAVTLSVPDVYADVLEEALETELKSQTVNKRFGSLNVTGIQLGGKTFVTNDQPGENAEELKRLQEVTEYLTNKLTNLEEETSQLKEVYETLINEHVEMKAKIARLQDHGGFSATLWKITGNFEENSPLKGPSHSELQSLAMHRKITRIYSQISDTGPTKVKHLQPATSNAQRSSENSSNYVPVVEKKQINKGPLISSVGV